MVGDIALGFCTKNDIEDVLRYVRDTCQKGCTVMFKKTDLDEYYLSVPICVGALLNDKRDSYIYVTPMVRSNLFYFDDLYAPEELTCITYDTETNEFISNVEYEGCVCKPIKYEKTLYIILPITNYCPADDDVRLQAHMHVAKQYFVCTG
jgi:hypothetical protein